MIYTQDKLYTLKRDLPIGSFKCVFRKNAENYEGLLVKDRYTLYLKSNVLRGGGESVKPYKYSWVLDNGNYMYYKEGGISSITVTSGVSILGEL